MVLSATAIRQAMKRQVVGIEPFTDEQLDRAHVDLHLEMMPGGADELELAPKSFVTVRTKEKLTLNSTICGFFDGRASLAKYGISVHQASMFIEPGTDTALMLEIFNASETPYTLKGGQVIGKVMFMALTDLCP